MIHCSMIFIVIVIVLISLLLCQSILNKRIDMMTHLKESVNTLDSMIFNANAALEKVAKEATYHCDDASQKLITNILLEKSSIQSLNIIHHNEITCSSLSSNVGFEVKGLYYPPIKLVTSILIVPDKPIVVVTKYQGDSLFFATLHGGTLFNTIQLLARQNVFNISFPGGWIGEGAMLHKQVNIDNLSFDSKLYPFSVSVNIAWMEFLIDCLLEKILLIVFLLLLGLLGSTYYYIYCESVVLKLMIKKGIQKHQFEPHFQAIVNNKGDIIGGEVLIRWRYKDLLISPIVFIPTAEKSAYIIAMTLDLLTEVYEQCIKYNLVFSKPFHLSFNICPIQLSQLHSEDLIKACRQFTDNAALSYINLILEVTERQIMINDTETLTTISRLNDLGIKIAIDDFGTGYSSLENIRDFKINIIKIDKCFIDNYPDSLCIDLIDNIIDLSQRLKIPLIAEGVESKIQADYLITKGVANLQGYLYHKPEMLSQFLNRLLKA